MRWRERETLRVNSMKATHTEYRENAKIFVASFRRILEAKYISAVAHSSASSSTDIHVPKVNE